MTIDMNISIVWTQNGDKQRGWRDSSATCTVHIKL